MSHFLDKKNSLNTLLQHNNNNQNSQKQLFFSIAKHEIEEREIS